ncbi:hypothetical protein [Clostridioides difficile]|uniref:hypothetical protein n=1 Tax=Clostridioides difficile TaxID=1496 RepID=UPI000D1E1344|nr:hypothetical protein [Clostridioides difficile]HBE9444629.1 hypothetical protein [Clostridioides difficile]
MIKMTNFEKVKNSNVKELSELLCKIDFHCDCYNCKNEMCLNQDLCLLKAENWLNSEVVR